MRGNLTIDKASMNLSYFLYTIQIIQNHGGKVSRLDFGKDMGAFIGIPAIKNGKENRTPYNKSKLPRYFGFVDVDVDSDGKTVLILTNRGKQLSQYIGCNSDAEASQMYYILPENRDDFIDLIFESVVFDTFGKNNCGAETSNTDVEPPKVVFKTIRELGKATAEEICFVMYGLNNGKFDTFEEAIVFVKEKRASFNYNYDSFMEEWNIVNIAHDCKIINLFTDPSIQLLRAVRDEEIGKNFYYLNPSLDNGHLHQIDTIQATYKPLNMFVYGSVNKATLLDWVTNSAFGRVSDDRFIIHTEPKNEPFVGNHSHTSWQPGAFEKALLQAFRYPQKNVFLLVDGITEQEYPALFGDYSSLLKRTNDLSDDDNGSSEKMVSAMDAYKYICANLPAAKDYLPFGKIYIPANVQFVCIVKSGESIMDKTFDFEFTRCLVNAGGAGGAEETEDQERVTGGTNIILYGVPGSGKSWTIAHDYCKNEKFMERIVFHPDYTYSDFVGQILPRANPDTKKVEYVFAEGPFTKIMMKAKADPANMYYLVIEEINRGNAAAIFGEIFQLLDRDDNGTSCYGITNYDIAGKVFDDQEHAIKIFSNLTILATMNTSDQNVFTLDTAFQRRWNMKHIPNRFTDKHGDDVIDGSLITWGDFVDTINGLIIESNSGFSGSADKRLGAYFARVNELQRKVFSEKVLKYLWDDAFKLNPNAIFKDEMKTLETVIETYEDESSSADPLAAVLQPSVYAALKKSE